MAKTNRAASIKSASKPIQSIAPSTTPPSPAGTKPATSSSMPASRIESKPAAEPAPEAIAEAAYFLWLRRGGHDTVNWLEAEQMLRRSLATNRT